MQFNEHATCAATPVGTTPTLVARPLLEPGDGIDLTDAAVRGIALRLRDLYGGNDVLNHIEAERLLHEALARLR